MVCHSRLTNIFVLLFLCGGPLLKDRRIEEMMRDAVLDEEEESGICCWDEVEGIICCGGQDAGV